MKVRIYRCEFGDPRQWCFEIDSPEDVNGKLYGYGSSWAQALEGARDYVLGLERRRDIPRLLT